jgi:threonine synthase
MAKNTPVTPVTPAEQHPKLAEAVGVADLFFKREDLHPYGSHKGRSIPVMIDEYTERGEKRFAISSSGNAALAAGLYVHELNAGKGASIELDIFIGNHIAPHKADKLKALADDHIRILLKERPLQALTQAVNEGVRSLRQSTDDLALIGYESLAAELVELGVEKKTGAVFIGTSSGTTAQALAGYFTKNKTPIQVHIVQTSSCHPISESFESYDGPDEASTADAIVDKTAHRKDALVPLIEKTGGRGWTVTNDEIEAAQELASEHAGLEISTNSALSIAGVMKAAAIGWEFPAVHKAVICLICGD